MLVSNNGKYLDFEFEKQKYFPSHLHQRFINLMFKSWQPRPNHPHKNLQAVFAAVGLNYTNLLQDFLSEYLL